MNDRRISGRRRSITAKAVAIIALISVIFGVLFVIVSDFADKKIYPKKYSEYVEKYSAEYGIPESVIYAVIKAESDFDPRAVSRADPPALGLMQLLEETYSDVARMLGETANPLNIYDPETNIKYGTYYLSYLYRRFENWENTFASYNAGLGNVYKWLEDPEYSDGEGNLTHIPFSETREYVKRVAKYRTKYEKIYYE